MPSWCQKWLLGWKIYIHTFRVRSVASENEADGFHGPLFNPGGVGVGRTSRAEESLYFLFPLSTLSLLAAMTIRHS